MYTKHVLGYVVLAGIVSLTPALVLAANLYSITLTSTDAQLLYIPDATQTNLDLSGDYTIEAWVRPNSIIENQPMDIVTKDGAGERGYGFTINGAPGGLQTFFLDASGNVSLFETDPAILVPNEWHHVAVVVDIDAPSATFYLDGVIVPTTFAITNATLINNNNAQFRIGTRDTDTFYFDGEIDEVRVWDTKRTTKQVQKSMAGTVIGNMNSLVGNWTFDGQTFEDSSKYGNHLTESTNASSVVFTTDTP